MLDVLTMFSVWRGKYIIPANENEHIDVYKNRNSLDFTIIKCQDKFDFPEEVKTLRNKISEELNLTLL